MRRICVIITVDRIFTEEHFSPVFSPGLKTYWPPRCREWKVGRAKAAHQGWMELISKIPEGEVCNYLGIMDTLGGPANFRPNCRIRSRCGRRFIGRVDGTYKLRFLFHPYGQPDLSLFLIRIPLFFHSIFLFFFSSSITNLYRLFYSQKTICKNLNSKYLEKRSWNIFRIVIFLHLLSI